MCKIEKIFKKNGKTKTIEYINDYVFNIGDSLYSLTVDQIVDKLKSLPWIGCTGYSLYDKFIEEIPNKY